MAIFLLFAFLFAVNWLMSTGLVSWPLNWWGLIQHWTTVTLAILGMGLLTWIFGDETP